MPAVVWLAYFGSLWLTAGVSWSAPMWAGAIVIAGIAGWLLSFVAALPRAASRGADRAAA